ncbi:alpha-D-ribose 1-methylphosphonate 5-triphosphate diphosphatase [Kaistia nematophila]|uniref:Alpha-D-ribose 1-methylphosphonate 5-triphosphate diphosphatase n=1 Tax=Kaistia nematophila TaxID=2994654 RepID=A0A9X3IPJ3_9HYPH|nr:alpha-D-ribose 1-methylphosphonate 5-triphosphate diphosphatase [Kaistia nematophila]MCX5572015.1 alpha-D-ribose 1-methylphosphonate 5-triphosphate diphosphatase [Kaistia nematophila]
MQTVLANFQIVTPDEILPGTVVLAGGEIEAVDAGTSRLPGAIDGEDDYLIPGLIDVHTDNLERHFAPRPAVAWPSAIGAVLAHDRDIFGAGITTVYDAISFGDYENGGERRAMIEKSIESLDVARAHELLRADHFLHFRCEVSDRGALEIFERHAGHPRLGVVSLMDHTPGQGQWSDLAIYRAFRRKKNGRVWTDAEFDAYIDQRRADREIYATPQRETIRRLASERRIPLASHDDTTLADVDRARDEGVTISEFPTTLAAAEQARAYDMKIVMGGPNVVLGRSHSGNVGAGELASRGLLDALTSDYVPTSLLEAVFVLSAGGMALPQAVATVTATPAAMLGLSDRGRIAPGLRADLLRVRVVAGVPVIRAAWRGGQRLA